GDEQHSGGQADKSRDKNCSNSYGLKHHRLPTRRKEYSLNRRVARRSVACKVGKEGDQVGDTKNQEHDASELEHSICTDSPREFPCASSEDDCEPSHQEQGREHDKRVAPLPNITGIL